MKYFKTQTVNKEEFYKCWIDFVKFNEITLFEDSEILLEKNKKTRDLFPKIPLPLDILINQLIYVARIFHLQKKYVRNIFQNSRRTILFSMYTLFAVKSLLKI